MTYTQLEQKLRWLYPPTRKCNGLVCPMYKISLVLEYGLRSGHRETGISFLHSNTYFITGFFNYILFNNIVFIINVYI